MPARSVVLVPPRASSFPPVVALHGLLGAPASMGQLAEALAWPGGVLAPVLFGHGLSAAVVPEGFDAAVDELSLSIPRGALLLGYSFGGRLALALAARAESGIRGALVVGAHLGFVTDEERSARVAWEDEMARHLRSGDLASFVDRWEKLEVFETQRGLAPELVAAQRRVRLGHQPEQIAQVFERLGTGRMPDLRPRLRGLELPVTFVSGSLDARYVAMGVEAASLSPKIEAVVVERVGHNVTLEAPRELAQLASARFRSWVSEARKSEPGVVVGDSR
jgi:2-succinyl-6-hydroxy-2,4-cyclohexadiene-1-carboxylate synthase